MVARKNDERPSVLKSKVGDSKLRRSVAQGRLKDIYGWEADKLGNIRVGWGFTGDQKTGVLKLRDKNNNWHDHSGLLAREAEVLGTPTDNPSNYYISMFDRKHASSSDNNGDDSETDPIIVAIERIYSEKYLNLMQRQETRNFSTNMSNQRSHKLLLTQRILMF